MGTLTKERASKYTIIVDKDFSQQEMDFKITDVVFKNCNLRFTHWYEISNVKFIGCDLTEAFFQWTIDIIFDTCNVDGLHMSGHRYGKLEIKNSDVEKLNTRTIQNLTLSNCSNDYSPTEFLKENFKWTDEGIIAYKTFNELFSPPDHWNIERGEVLTENVDFDEQNDCSYGINVGTEQWVRKNCLNRVWKVLIPYEALPETIVPYDSDGKIRTSKIRLLHVVDQKFLYE